MDWNGEALDMVKQYQLAADLGTLHEMEMPVGSCKQLHNLLRGLAISLKLTKLEVKAADDEIASLRRVDTVSIRLDPKKVDPEKLAQGRQFVDVPVTPTVLESWQNRIGKDLHLTQFRVGEWVSLKEADGCSSLLKVSSILICQPSGFIAYTLSNGLQYMESQLRKAE